MKKILALLLAFALCLSMCACSANFSAYNKSKKAFNHITTAYQKVNEFSEDIYEAWRLGTTKESSPLSDFASEMHIDSKHIEQAVLNICEEEEYTSDLWYDLPTYYGDSTFSAWVSVISEAYECSGDADEIRDELDEAKSIMRILGTKYSDYEHYSSLKEYFTNTLAFFDFCCNPEGSFEQVVETINEYRNNARACFFDLNYVFGDSIDGFHTEEDEENEEETSVT